jgi:coenzyme F420-reducing hydrogenase delta subunit
MHRVLRVAAADMNHVAPVIAFACRQGAVRALDEAGRLGLSIPRDLLVVDVPCAGLVSDRILLDAIEQGARGVMVLGCHHDNCRSLWGSDLTGSRVEALRKKLGELGAGEQRICFHPVAANEAFRLIHLLEDSMGRFPGGRAFEPDPYREVPGGDALQEVSHG